METNLMRRVYINGNPERLPKESGYYFTHKKKNYEVYPTHPFDISYFNKNDKTYIDYWKSIDWYLVPVPRSEIIEILKKHSVKSAPSGSVIFNCEFENIADEIIGGK